MHKLKGLITDIKGNEEASTMILPFNKKIEDYFKSLKRINQVYNKIFIEPHTYFITQLSNLNRGTLQQMKSVKNKPGSYGFLVDILSEVQKTIRATNNEIKSYSDQGFIAILDQCEQIKKLCEVLNQRLNLHQIKQKELNQSVKKYSKSYKNFIQAMDSYKMSFQDVKLIYNIQQKTKRYKACYGFFSSAVSELQQINQIIKVLAQQRSQLKQILQKYKSKSLQFIRIVGQQVIKIPQNIIKCFLKSNKQIFRILSQKSKLLKEKQAKILFQKFRLPFPNPQFFDCELDESEKNLYPSFLHNLKSLKPQNFGKSKKFLIEYFISTREDIKQRLEANDIFKSYFSSLGNIFDRLFLNQQKDAKDMINQKYVKMVELNFTGIIQENDSQQNRVQNKSDSFKISQTIQTMVVFLDDNRQLTKNMYKIYSQHVRQLINEIEEENKNIVLFKEQFKNKFYNLFDGKKEFKKDIETLKSGQVQSLTLTQEQVNQMRPQIIKKSSFILLLINGFAQKFKSSSGKVKVLIQSFLNDYAKHFTYQKELYEKYKVKLEQFTTAFVEKRINESQTVKDKFWVNQNSLYQAVVIENTKIKFDSQIDKVNDFKKVKKPTQNFEQKIDAINNLKQKSASPLKKETNENINSPLKKNSEQFVRENTNFEQGQKYVGKFKCGLCDNIIVSGKLYITTKRLFFHSRFNSSNIFFGDTKLQIPCYDIKKIEKKYNALIFDNSISITTVNGQIFFTSFISRNQAYDLICKTFDINLDDEVFVSDYTVQNNQQAEDAQDFNINIQQEDDMPDCQLQARQKKIDQMLESDQNSDEKSINYEYIKVLNQELNFPGLNAAKVFKIFESGQEMPYKNKTFENFWHYFKGVVHKNEQLNVQAWQPNVLEFLNPSNIKKNTPLKFIRKISTMVPAPQSSIPFMPKFVCSDETHEVYVYSKDKIVIVVKVFNSKAPYTDTFYLRYRKTFETKGENVVRLESNLKLVFVKKTMMQGMIQSKTLKQSIDNNKSLTDEMQKYLNYLQNNLVKKQSKKGSKVQDMSTTDGQNPGDQRGLDKTELIEAETFELKKKLQSVSAQKETFKKIMLVSLLLNTILLLIVFN